MLPAEFSKKSDHEIVELAKKNSDVFAEIVKRYDAKLTRYINRLTNVSLEEKEDLLQEIFIKVYKNLNNIDTKLSFSSWIYRIAHNHTISSFRKSKSRPSVVSWDADDNLLNQLKGDFDIHLSIEKKETKKEVLGIIDKLNTKYKDIILLKYIEQQSYEEISGILKIPPGTVATRLNRAKKQMKKLIEKKGKTI